MKRIVRFFDSNPKVELSLEIFLNVLLGFFPVAAASLFAQLNSPEFSQDEYMSVFHSYFDSGELSLLILATCGSIVWVSFIKKGYSHIFVRFFVSVFVVLCTILFVGGILANNPGFQNTVPNWVWWALVGLYILTLVVWFLVSIARADGPPSDDSEERADKIVADARSGK
jgi:hypothetical protein